MSETETPTEEHKASPNVLDRVLGRDTQASAEETATAEEEAPATQPTVSEGGCVNCANNGQDVKLNNGVCPTCGFEAPEVRN